MMKKTLKALAIIPVSLALLMFIPLLLYTIIVAGREFPGIIRELYSELNLFSRSK